MRRSLGLVLGAVVGIGLVFGATPASAAVSPPTIANSFNAARIALNGTVTLTFSIANLNGSTFLTGVAFTDNLPAGLVVAQTPNLSNTCGGTVTAVAGSGTISLTGGTMSPGSCGISVTLTGTTAGIKNNTTGSITSTESGPGNASNTAVITVVGPPQISEAFGAASIPVHASTSLTFTIQNNNTTVALHGVGFTDQLPPGLVVAASPALSNSCGGTATAVQSGTAISLSAGMLASSASCVVSVNVTAIAAGQQTNVTSNVTSTEGGAGDTASASLTVQAPPSIAIAFDPTAIAPGSTSQLTFTLTNPSADVVPENGVAVVDTLPTGLAVIDDATPTCGGTLTVTSATSTIALTGGVIPTQGTCHFSVLVTAASAGHYLNTTGAVTSTNGGTGDPASATLNVANPPTIAESFSAPRIQQGATATLTYTIANPSNPIALTGLAFTDNLPAGLQIAANPSVTDACGGTLTASPGTTTVSLSSGSVSGGATCTISLVVKGVAAGPQDNAVQISPTDGPPGNTAHAVLLVVAPPSISLAFAPASITTGGHSTLRVILTNPNASTDLTGVAFTSTLPDGLAVAKPANASGSCGGIGLSAAGETVALANAKLPAGTSCTLTVNVAAHRGGVLTVSSGPVSSLEGGEGSAANATLHATISNAFTLSHVHGLRVDVKVPGPGKVTARESSKGPIATAVVHAKRAGTVHLHLKLTAKGRNALRAHHGTLKVTLTVTFAPAGGKPRTRTVRGVKLTG